MFNSPSTQKPLNVFYACHKDPRYIDDDHEQHAFPEPDLVATQELTLRRGATVMNQPQNPISHLSPTTDINHDIHDSPSYVYIELFLPLYLFPVLLQLIQYLMLVFMWN